MVLLMFEIYESRKVVSCRPDGCQDFVLQEARSMIGRSDNAKETTSRTLLSPQDFVSLLHFPYPMKFFASLVNAIKIGSFSNDGNGQNEKDAGIMVVCTCGTGIDLML
mmetsp:Transcript_20960/g.44232  ORF Transcript_20960/g.44232 Transcript_20960/m.44232 type:complete len:108 (+) Transcript_20960:2889-3212(+)